MHNYIKFFAFLIVTLITYSTFWFMVNEKFIETIDEKSRVHSSAGSKIKYSKIYTSGFPFWLHVHIEKPVFSKSNKNLSWSWYVSELKISARPWNIDKVEIISPGKHLVVIKTKNKTWELDVNVKKLKIFLGWLKSSFYPNEVQVEIKQALYRSEPFPGFGIKTEAFVFHLRAMGEIPKSIITNEIEYWRKKGGVLEVNDIILKHGPVRIKGEGTLALNKDLQPMGAFSLEVGGYMEAVDRLQSSRLILPSEARFTKAILSMLAVKKKKDKNHEIDKIVKLPLIIQDRFFYLGPLVLGRVPILNWQKSM